MDVKQTTFEITDEIADRIENGTILALEIRVHREIEYESGTFDHTYFSIKFQRNGPVDDLRWNKTATEHGGGGMRDAHVIATREAADHVGAHYNPGVDLGQLECAGE